MKRNGKGVFLLILLLALAGCAGPRQPQPPEGLPPFSNTAPAEAETLYSQAENAYRAGQVPQAINSWEKVVQKYPNTSLAARSLNRLGEIYLAQGQYERATQFFEYLVYTYPRWDGIGMARLNQLRLMVLTGKKKQAMKEASALWDSSSDPEMRLGLSKLMMQAHEADNDIEAAFDWSASGFSVASTPEQKKALSDDTVRILDKADEGLLKKLSKKNISPFMRTFVDYRYAQIEAGKGQEAAANERLAAALAQSPGHPLAPAIQAALKGTKVVAAKPLVRGGGAQLPLNADRVGVLVPLNGPNAKYGDMVVRGLNMGVSDWNDKHPEQKVTLVIKDAGSDPTGAVESFGELTKKEGVLGIIGPLGAQAAKEVIPLAGRDGVPLLAMTQKEDDAEHPYVLHAFIDSRDLVRTLVRHCREKLKYERFACLFPNDRYGQRLAKIFSEVVQEQGGNMIASASYKEKSTDFNEPLQKLMTIAKKNAPLSATEGTPFEALFIPDQVQSVSLIAPQLPYNNIVGVTLLGTNLWSEAPLVQSGGVYVEQALFATSFYPESQDQKVSGFREKYESIYNAAPSYLEAQAYDALILLLQSRNAAARSGGSPGRDAVFQSMSQAKDFKGVAGTYTVSPRGDLERQYTILQVVNGQLTQVQP
ncbi:MAG: penicillin-binding protein activator [Syntrophobacter sp.]